MKIFATLTSFAACYFLGVACWYVLKRYYAMRDIQANNYHAFIASILSIIVITAITRAANIMSDGSVVAGIVVMGLFSADIHKNPDPNYRKKTLAFMFIGCIAAGILSALLSRISWLG